MSWVTEMINGIPQIVENIAPGFILMAAFCWTISHNITDGKIVIIISITLSYIVGKVTKFLNLSNTNLGMVCVCLALAVLGIIAAVIYKSETINDLIAILGIKRTTNKSVWDDVIGSGSWIALLNSETKQYYCGRFQYQSYENEKCYRVISTYYVADMDGKIVGNKDYTQDPDRTIMVFPEDYKEIIISKKDPFKHYEM